MSSRTRHPKKDLEALLKNAEQRGWRIVKTNRYFRAYCPCGSCLESVALTPSDPNYAKNKHNKMAKCPMWED